MRVAIMSNLIATLAAVSGLYGRAPSNCTTSSH